MDIGYEVVGFEPYNVLKIKVTGDVSEVLRELKEQKE